MNRDGEEWQTHSELNVHDLNWVDGGHGESGRLLVLVVELVEVLVQPWGVVQAVEDVGRVVLKHVDWLLVNNIHFMSVFKNLHLVFI